MTSTAAVKEPVTDAEAREAKARAEEKDSAPVVAVNESLEALAERAAEW